MKSDYFKNEEYGLEFVHLVDCKKAFPLHNHVSVYSVGIVLEGEIIITKGNDSLKLAENNLYIIPPYMPHGIKPVGDGYSLLTLCIKESMLNNIEMNNLLKSINDLGKGFCGDKLITQNHIDSIIESVTTFISPHNQLLFSEDINNVQKDIVENPQNSRSIDDIANSIFVSKYYFIRKFRNEIGLSPHNFRIQNRIRKAKFLLEQGLPILDVAVDTGFFDQSHFIKYFIKYVGLSPSEYIDSVNSK